MIRLAALIVALAAAGCRATPTAPAATVGTVQITDDEVNRARATIFPAPTFRDAVSMAVDATAIWLDRSPNATVPTLAERIRFYRKIAGELAASVGPERATTALLELRRSAVTHGIHVEMRDR